MSLINDKVINRFRFNLENKLAIGLVTSQLTECRHDDQLHTLPALEF